MLAALRIRDFRLLWSARSASLLGSWLLVVAAPAYVFQLSHSIVAVGLTTATIYVPILIIGPIAGVLSDRWDRRLLMVSMDLLRLGAISLFFLVHSVGTVWIMYLAMTLESAGTVLFYPAAQALTPLVVGKGKALTGAVSLNSVTDAVARLAGAPLGAVLALGIGFHLVVGLDMASYLISAALIFMTRKKNSSSSGDKLTLHKAGIMLAEGISSVRRIPIALALLPSWFMYSIANASMSAFLIPFGITHWGGQRQVGLIISALGAGFLLGAPVSRAAIDRFQPGLLLGVALALSAAGCFALFSSDAVLGAMAAAVVTGLFGSQVLTIPQVTLQRVVPDSVLGRVSATFYSVEALATLLGALAGPAIAQSAGYTWIVSIACSLMLITGLLSFLRIPSMALGNPDQNTGNHAHVGGVDAEA
jgi:MFS family permease